MVEKEIEEIRRELGDVKALLIIFLQNLKVDNQKISDAIGMSPGRISQLINKNKYPRK